MSSVDQEIEFPRYKGFTKSLYRNSANYNIPIVKNEDLTKVYPNMVCWQFPDLKLLDWLYVQLEKKSENGELSDGQCTYENSLDVHKDIKDSYDLPIFTNQIKLDEKDISDFNLATLTLDNWIRQCCMEYIMHNPLYAYKSLCIEDSLLQYQFYYPGGGFKKLHSERNLCHHDPTTQQRELVFMIYLNDIKNKDNMGGTHFVNRELTLPCKKGLTCIFPAGIDFAHVGSIHSNERKAIVTGWILTHPM